MGELTNKELLERRPYLESKIVALTREKNEKKWKWGEFRRAVDERTACKRELKQVKKEIVSRGLDIGLAHREQRVNIAKKVTAIGFKGLGHVVIWVLFVFGSLSVLLVGAFTFPFGILLWVFGGGFLIWCIKAYLDRVRDKHFTEFLTEPCPHCGHALKIRMPAPGVTCPACLRRSIIREKQLVAVNIEVDPSNPFKSRPIKPQSGNAPEGK